MSATVALLVTDAAKASVTSDLNGVTPSYTLVFTRTCAAIDPAMTWHEPATHWYASGGNVPDLAAWQEYAAEHPELVLFIAYNAVNPYDWAVSNLASQGLQFVPVHEIE